jgi:lysozyme
MREINDAGIELIKSFETLQLVGMLPTPHDVPTAGWGHTGPFVALGVKYTEEQALGWLFEDLAWAESTVDGYVGVRLNDNQFAALVSLVFNIGETAFKHSTILKNLNVRDFKAASLGFLAWDHQKGVRLAGLTRRREAERALFDTPVAEDVRSA